MPYIVACLFASIFHVSHMMSRKSGRRKIFIQQVEAEREHKIEIKLWKNYLMIEGIKSPSFASCKIAIKIYFLCRLFVWKEKKHEEEEEEQKHTNWLKFNVVKKRENFTVNPAYCGRCLGNNLLWFNCHVLFTDCVYCV